MLNTLTNRSRYEARETGPADHPHWAVFDTFTQSWVVGEAWELKAKAERRAYEINHAYERTL